MKSLLNNSNLTINLVDLAADSITSDNITSQTISATATTESVSTSTGSIICSGGIGVAKNLNVGGAINATGSISGSILSGPVSTSSLTLTGVAPSIKVEATNRLTFGLYSTNFGSFAPILIQNSDDIGSYPVSASIATSGGLHVEKSVNIAGTTDSTSTSTGAIICAGGLGLSKKLFVGGGQTTIEGSNYPTLSVQKAGTSEAATFSWDTMTPRALIQTSSELYPIYMGGSAFQVNTSGVSRVFVNSAGNVGIGTASPSVKLDVVGDLTLSGILTKGGGSFLIDHPDPTKSGKYKLRHSFVESNTRGDNIYRYKVTTVNKRAVIDLPSYFQYLNENAQALVSPVSKICGCCAIVDEELNQVVIESSFDTEFHVLVIGTRKDALAMRYWPNGKSEEEEIIVQPPKEPSVEPIEVSSKSKPKKHRKVIN